MRVGFFKRSFSAFIDLNLLLGVTYLLFILIASNMLQNGVKNYEEHNKIYNQNVEVFNSERNIIDKQLENKEITQDEHRALFDAMMEDFNEENQDYEATLMVYAINVVLYFIVTYAVLNYVYNLMLSGQTIGRRMMKIRLDGNITWYSLLMREFFYKTVFWFATLSAGIAIDIGLIAFTKRKKTIRDYISNTYLVHEGVSYPF